MLQLRFLPAFELAIIAAKLRIHIKMVVLATAFCLSTAAWYARPADASTVTVLRDRYGVPSIVADSYADAAYGIGYATAQDDAVVAERNFKRARGRLAEVDGQSQLLGDVAIRALGLEDRAQGERGLLGKDAAIIDRYCRGFNKGLAEQKGTLPKWTEPVGRVDVIALAEYINCVMALYESGLYQSPLGSNEFAVAPKRTADGHAIVSLNPHLPWAAPFLWYEFAVYTPDVHFRGVTLPGLPLGIMGHTNKVAWAMTNNDPHFFSYYQIKTDASHPGQYLYEGRWLSFKSKTLSIGVWNGKQVAQTPFPVQFTEWGPVVPGQPVAARLDYPDPVDTMRQAAAMIGAQNAKQFRQALGLCGESMWNFVYADTLGNIGYQYNAYLRRRDSAFDWDAPVPGDDPKTMWGSPLSIDELPHVDNPASGVLVNCNSAPWRTSLGTEIPRRWPAYITSFDRNTRSDRLTELLSHQSAMTVDDAKRIATDTLVPSALATVAALKLASASTQAPDVAAAPALATLEAWDGRSDVNSKGCALFWYWLQADSASAGLAQQAQSGAAWTADNAAKALAILNKAAENLKKDHGKLDIPWGEIHVADRGVLSNPVPGFDFQSLTSVDPNDGDFKNGAVHCDHGSSFRMIVDLDPKGVRSWSVLPFGESQNSSSAHFSDQAKLFGQSKFKETFFGLANAKKYAVSSCVLQPAP